MSTTLTWTLQKSSRAKGSYYQASIGRGKHRRTITLGYQDELEAERFLQNLRIGGSRLVRLRVGAGDDAPLVDIDHEDARFGTPIMSDDQIRRWATAPAASDVIEEIVAELEEGEFRSRMQSGDYAGMRFGDFVERIYLPVRRQEVAAGTSKREAWTWGKILPALGSVPLGQVDGVKIAAWLSTQTSWHGPGKRCAQNAIRCALRYAEEIGAIKEMPKTRPIRGSTKRVLADPVSLTHGELRKLLSHAPSAAHRALWSYAVGQGCRREEATILRWEDVNWGANEVHVRGTKTEGSDRVVPLTPMTLPELRSFWVAQGQPRQGRCFVYKRRPIGSDWGNALKTAAEKAQIKRRVFPTLLRHTFVTLAFQAGVPKGTVKFMLGHSAKSEMVDRVYDSPHEEHVREGLAKLGRIAS